MSLSKKYYIVYIVTNLINGKKYIGSHLTNDINDGYLGSGVNIKKSIKKYGKNNFNKEILGYTNNISDMKELEEYYLNYYNCVTSPTFYNATKYASGITYNTWGDKIRESNKGNKYRLGKIHSEETKLKMSLSSVGINNLTENGRKKQKYKKLNNKYALGNKFSEDSKILLGKNHEKEILQFDLRGKFIREWGSIREASYNITGNRLNSGISTCCNNNSFNYLGYIWEFKGSFNLNNIIKKVKLSKTKFIHQLDVDGIFIKEWNSGTEAANSLGILRSGISRVCNKNKPYGGFIWKSKNV